MIARQPCRLVLLATFIAAGCGDPSPRTEVLVSVDAEAMVRSGAARLRVVVSGGAGRDRVLLTERDRREWGGAAIGIAWPVPVAVIPLDDDASRVFEVRAEALDAPGATIATARLVSGFVSARTLAAHLVIYSGCSETCDEAQTCTPSGCVDSYVPPTTLRDFGSDAGLRVPDAGLDAGLDSGLDAGVDASLAIDAGTDSGLDAGPPCSTGPDGHCYVFVPEAQTWALADAGCVALGGHLVTIGSTSEQDFAWTLSAGGWIGGTDEGSEGTWRWTTGETWVPQWGPTQPDNAAGSENCAALWPGFGGQWADVSCDSMLPSICELP